MKQLKQLSSLLAVALFAVLLATVGGLPVVPTFGALIAGGVLIGKQTGVLAMAVTVEIWQRDIIDNLFKDNQFAQYAFNADQYVVAGAIVHIPQAGAPTPSIKNNNSFPLTAVKRADTDITYGLDTYYQPPKFVENVEQYELSYDKRRSVAGEMQDQLIQDAMDGLLFRWGRTSTTGAANANIGVVPTSGADSALDLLPSATGTRKLFTKAVFSAVKKSFDKDNIPARGRYVLLTATHHQQLIDSFSDTESTNFHRSADLQRGIIGMYLGFQVMMRSSVQRWRKTSGVWNLVDVQDAGFAANAADSEASLFWQENCVERARGEVNVFENANDATYYGDVFSMNMRLGGRVRRATGVRAVVSEIGA